MEINQIHKNVVLTVDPITNVVNIEVTQVISPPVILEVSEVGRKGDQGEKGDTGLDGFSAYEIAINNGTFVGTELEFATMLGSIDEKLDKGTYTGNAQDLKTDIDNIYQPDVVIRYTAPTRVGNTFTFPNGGYDVLLSKQFHTNTSELETTIAAATDGFKRIDLIYYKADDTIAKIQGTESATVAVRPEVPAGGIELCLINVFGDTIEVPEVNGAYVQKSERSNVVLTGSGVINQLNLVDEKATIVFKGSITQLNTISYASVPYNGKRITLFNAQATPVTIGHSVSGYGVDFVFPDAQDYILLPNQTIEFSFDTTYAPYVHHMLIGSKTDISGKEDKANKATNFTTVNNTLYPSVQAVKSQLDLKANDSDVLHKTGNESKTGNLSIIGTTSVKSSNPKGSFHVFTGTSGSDIDMIGQENGSISFSNSGISTASPTIVSKSNDAQGLTILTGTNNTNPLYDMGFNVHENDNTDFSTLTTKAYSFKRFDTELFSIYRNGKSEFLNQVKTTGGNFIVGTNSETGIASFYNNKNVTQHADYGFLEDSDLNYSGVGLQGHASFADNLKISGIQDSDHHNSFQAYPYYQNSGTITYLKGFFMQPSVTAGTVTNLFEFEANDPIGVGGTITNLHGVHVRELTKGANNYAFFSEGATPSFIGGTYLGNSKVGIGGTTTPTANLEVIDSNQTASGDGNVTIRTTDSQAADKGGFLTFGGSFSGTSRTVFGGISGRKENSTANDIQGYISLYYSKNGVGLKEGVRLNSRGALLINKTDDDLTNQLQVAGTISASPATTANQVVVKSQLDAESDSQIEISANSNTLDAWNKKTILFTANCTITVPATLLLQFGFVFRTLAGVTVTWQITAPFTWETTPTTTPEKTTGNFMRRGSTNTILLDF